MLVREIDYLILKFNFLFSSRFELFSKTPISKGKIFSIKLHAVRGDHLISHLLKICSSQAVKLSTFYKSADELASLRQKCGDLEKQVEKLSGVKEEFEEMSEKFKELEDEVELVKEERENIRLLVEDKEDEVADLKQDTESLQKQLEENQEELEIVGNMLREEQGKVDQLQKRNVAHQKEIGKLRAELGTAQRNLEKADQLLKRNSQQQNQQSLDMRKLGELEADLKEKDSMVESLTETIGILRKELENEKLKAAENMDSFEKLSMENENLKEKIAHYRAQRFSPAPSGLPGLQTGLTNRLTPSFKPVLGPHTPYGANLNSVSRSSTK